jgi:hypothetical protein
VPSHRSTLIDSRRIGIQPSHFARSHRQIAPPRHSAKPVRQLTPPTDTAKRGAGQRAPTTACDHSPLGGSVLSHRRTLIDSGRIGIQPSHSAKSLRQVTPPSHSAKSLRQVAPPSHSAKPLRQVTPRGRSARSVRQVGPPGRSARSVRQVTPPSRSPPGGGWRKAGRGVAWSLAKTRQNCGRIRGSVTEQERLSPKRACRARSTSPGRRPGFRPPDRAGPVGAVHRGRAESAGSRHSARTNPVPAFHQHSGRGKGWKPFPPLQRPTSSVIPHQTHSARSLRQATPPSRSAKPLRQATPPRHSAKSG